MPFRFWPLFLLVVYQSFMSVRADTIPNRFAAFQANYGFIIPHSKAIEPVSHTRPFGFEISLNKLQTSYGKWKVFNAYWIWGIQAGYLNFQNPDVIGSACTITLFAEPVAAFSRRLLVTVRGGTGLSYHTKVYNEITNPANFFFSTKINFPLYLDVRLKYRIGEKFFLTFSGCYNHISNGGFKLPNKGMNFPTLAAGLEYFPQKIPELNRDFQAYLKVPKPGITVILQVLSTIKLMEKNDSLPEKDVFAYGFNSRISRQVSSFYSINAGAELIFDGYIREAIRRDNSGLDYKRFALTVGQDFLLGSVSFTQCLGIYLYSPYKARNPVYQKYELAYRFNRHFGIGVFLKAHLQVAELMGVHLTLYKDWNRNTGICERVTKRKEIKKNNIFNTKIEN